MQSTLSQILFGIGFKSLFSQHFLSEFVVWYNQNCRDNTDSGSDEFKVFKFDWECIEFYQKYSHFWQILTFLSLFLMEFGIFDRFWQFQPFNWHLDDQTWSFNQNYIKNNPILIKKHKKWMTLIKKWSKIVGFWHHRLIGIQFWHQILNRTDFVIQKFSSKFQSADPIQCRSPNRMTLFMNILFKVIDEWWVFILGLFKLCTIQNCFHFAPSLP